MQAPVINAALSEHPPEIQSSLTRRGMPPADSPALKDRATVILPLRGQGGEALALSHAGIRKPSWPRCRNRSKCPRFGVRCADRGDQRLALTYRQVSTTRTGPGDSRRIYRWVSAMRTTMAWPLEMCKLGRAG